MEQSGRNDPISDLSNDVKRDKSSPKESSNKEIWSGHLIITAGASSGAINALDVAWSEYEKVNC